MSNDSVGTMKSLTASMCLRNSHSQSMFMARGNQEPLSQYLLQEAVDLNSISMILNHKAKVNK